MLCRPHLPDLDSLSAGLTCMAFCIYRKTQRTSISYIIIFLGEEGGKRTPGNSWWGCPARFSKSCPFLRPKNVIFHPHFQTKPRKSIPIFRPGLQAEIMSSSLRLECKQKTSSNAFQVRIPYIFYFVLIYLELKP